jgi:lysophospholipase L1-like esterase
MGSLYGDSMPDPSNVLPRSVALGALLCLGVFAQARTPASLAPAGSPVSPPPVLSLDAGQPPTGARISFGDADVQQALTGDSARMTLDPKLPNAVIEARRVRQAGGGSAPPDALGLHWKDAWMATLRIDTPPLDLRPYLASGVLSFDLKVNELAQGGLAYRVDCGAACERKVIDVVAARAAQGKGWQHLRYALRCFWRDGDDYGAVTRPFALDGTGAGDVDIANVRIEPAGRPNVACPDYRTASVTPAPLEESWSLSWWMPRHEEKLAEAARRQAAGEPTGLVFIGDSITHNWENEQGKAVWTQRYTAWHPLNLGFAGDRTENLLWRIQHGELDGIAPKVAVMLVGTNNSGARHDDPAATVAGIRADIEALRARLPHTKVLLLAIFPRGEGPGDEVRRMNDRVNALLPGLADGKQIVFLDIGQAFLAPDGTLSKDIMPDLLHPNARGYQIWADAMAPALERLMQ